jgi:hypothetical protein
MGSGLDAYAGRTGDALIAKTLFGQCFYNVSITTWLGYEAMQCA